MSRNPYLPVVPDDAGVASVVVLIGNVLLAAMVIAFMLMTFGYVIFSTTAQQAAEYTAQAVANANLPVDLTSPDFTVGARYTQNATPTSVMTQIGADVLQGDLGSMWEPSDRVTCVPLARGAGSLTQASARDAVTCTVTLTSPSFDFFGSSLLSVTRQATATAVTASTQQLTP